MENFITRPPGTFHMNKIYATVHLMLYVTFIYIMILWKKMDIDNKLRNHLKITGILNNLFRPQNS